MEPKVAVIIASWNGKKFIDNCLSSIFGQSYSNYEVIFVDNASTDGTSEYVREKFPAARLLRIEKNRGFTGGNNLGIAEALKDPEVAFVALVSIDTMADKNFLKALVDAAMPDDRIGACQPKMMSMVERGVIDAAGVTFDKDGCAIQIGYKVKDDGRFDQEKEIFGVCAGAALYRRKMLAEIGTFDEDLFMYLEDVDLVLRARLAGWRSVYVPSSIIYHNHSHAYGDESPFKLYLCQRNEFFYMLKNMPRDMVISFYWRALKRFVVYAYFNLKKGKFTATDKAFYKANLDGLLGIPGTWLKRRKIRHARKTSDNELKKWFVGRA